MSDTRERARARELADELLAVVQRKHHRKEIYWRAIERVLESEAALARKQEREALSKLMCDCCGQYAKDWEPAAKINERWRHTSKHIPDEGKPRTYLCDAAKIHERNLAETGA